MSESPQSSGSLHILSPTSYHENLSIMPSYNEDTEDACGISKTFFAVMRIPDRKPYNFRLVNKNNTGRMNKMVDLQ